MLEEFLKASRLGGFSISGGILPTPVSCPADTQHNLTPVILSKAKDLCTLHAPFDPRALAPAMPNDSVRDLFMTRH